VEPDLPPPEREVAPVQGVRAGRSRAGARPARRVLQRHASAAGQYSIASKVFCTQAAFDVASDALQIYGGNGLSREYPIEKLLRDARASMIEDGCNDLLSLVGAEKLW